jgi:two-component system response regulator YesN
MASLDICPLPTGSFFQHHPRTGSMISGGERGYSAMLSLVIVDDERGIIELIKNLIDFTRVNVEVVGEAENGVEAYQLILAKRPDVVITDIRMPGMNGIELIAKVNETGLRVSFVVISGYRDFDYAQNALKFGAVDYLLKPIKQTDLNQLLAHLDHKKESSVAREIEVQSIQEQLEVSMNLLRQTTLWDLLSDDPERIRKGLRAMESKTFFHFKPGKFCVALVKIDGDSATGIHYPTDSIEVIMGKFMRKLQSDCFEIESVCEKTMGYLVFNYAPGKHSTLEQKSQYLHDVLRSDAYRCVFFDVTVAFGQEENEINQIAYSAKTALEALRHRIDLGCGCILNYSKLVKKYPAAKAGLSDFDQKKLRKYIENPNKPECLNVIHTLFRDYLSSHLGIAFGLYGYCEDLLRYIDDLICNLLETRPFNPDRYLECIENCTTVADLERVCHDYVSDILDFFVTKKENQDYKPIRLIKQYVQEHYAQPISLDDMARLVHFNPVYVSAVFKKETGMSFTGYLTEVRLAEAKKLLKTTSLNIGEIARIVGYNDVRYFSQLFIKSVGVKPVEYRKFYS